MGAWQPLLLGGGIAGGSCTGGTEEKGTGRVRGGQGAPLQNTPPLPSKEPPLTSQGASGMPPLLLGGRGPQTPASPATHKTSLVGKGDRPERTARVTQTAKLTEIFF